MQSSLHDARMSKLWISTPWFRYTILILNCLLTLGSYYVFDMCTVLQSDLEKLVTQWSPGNEGLYYNLLYTVYAWTNCAMSLAAGVIVDRLGTRKSVFIFSTFVIFGQSLFALGGSLVQLSDQARYIIIFSGRFIYGLGGGSITIVQNVITARYFKGKELAMAFGVTLSVSRLGSVVNYDVTTIVYENICSWFDVPDDYKLGLTLWFGALLCVVGLGSGVAFAILDSRYDKWLVAQGELKQGTRTRRKFKIEHIKKFPAIYWLVCFTIMSFYCIVFPFQSDAKQIFMDKFQMKKEAASFNAGLTYTVSIIMSAPFGRFVDWFGRRAAFAVCGSLLTTGAFVMFSVGGAGTYVPMIMIGIGYSVCAAVLWPCIALLVDMQVLGTANGLATCLQMIGIGCFNFAVGSLKDSYGWWSVLLLFICLGGVSSALSFGLIVLDRRDRLMWTGQRDKVKPDSLAVNSDDDALRQPLMEDA